MDRATFAARFRRSVLSSKIEQVFCFNAEIKDIYPAVERAAAPLFAEPFETPWPQLIIRQLKDKITIRSWNGDFWREDDCPAEVTLAGPKMKWLALRKDRLRAIIKVLWEEARDFSDPVIFNGWDKGECLIEMGEAKFRLPCKTPAQTKEKFFPPQMPWPARAKGWKPGPWRAASPDEFLRAFRPAKAAAMQTASEKMEGMRGVFWGPSKSHKGKTDLVATNGHRLGHGVFPVPHLSPKGFMISKSGMMEIERSVKAAKAKKDEENQGLSEVEKQPLSMFLSFGKQYLFVEIDSQRLAIPIMDASRFPEWELFVPKSGKTVLIDKGCLVPAVKRAALLASPVRPRIDIEIKQSKLKLLVNNDDVGQSTEVLDINCDDEASFGLNRKYALEAIQSIEGKEILMIVGGPTDPVCFRPSDSEGMASVVMPMGQPL